MNIAEMLIAWRKFNGFTTTEAAKRLGIDRLALRRLEHGQPICHANLAAVLCWLLSS